MLKSRNHNVPHGFLFYQPETNWSPKKSVSDLGFWPVVEAIIEHRLGNPRHGLSTDKETVAWELETATVKRLESMPGTKGYLTSGSRSGASPPNPTAAPRQNAVVAAGASLNKTTAGIGVLLDWLGDGGIPVDKGLSESRASVCATFKWSDSEGKHQTGCWFNNQGDFTSWFTVPASEMIRKQIEIKNDLKLETSHDEKLGVCEVCACPLKLKTHTPISHIAEHLSENVRSKLPPHCWIPKELASL